MKIGSFILVLVLVISGVVFFSLHRPAPDAPPAPAEVPIVADLEPRQQPREPVALPLSFPAPDASGKMLERMNQMISKLENLEISVREARTEITLRSEERSRTSVTAYPSNATSKLGDQDLENLRGIIREELLSEAWKARQEEIVKVGRNIANQLALEARTIDPMIEVLCADGRTIFDLERELAGVNHDRDLAKRRIPDFRLARRRLRDDLRSVYRDDELAARVFLFAASNGEVASLRMERERLLATEKEWLR